MLSEQDKKDMLADARNTKSRDEFLKAERHRKGMPRTLDDYIAFLMFVQKIKPFEHKMHIPPNTDKNIL